MIKILIGLIILSVMVFIHELGHFIAAKMCGVIVESFSMGWGPILFKKKKRCNRIPHFRHPHGRVLRNERGKRL